MYTGSDDDNPPPEGSDSKLPVASAEQPDDRGLVPSEEDPEKRFADIERQWIPAGFWLRFFAFLLDLAILTLLQTALTAAQALAGNASWLQVLLQVFIANLVYYLFFFVYFAVFESSSYTATPGKMALGLAVVSEDYQQLSFLRALGRNLGKILSSLTLFLGYIIAGFTERKQALHDLMASSVVLKDLEVNPTRRSLWAFGSILAVIVTWFFSYSISMTLYASLRPPVEGEDLAPIEFQPSAPATDALLSLVTPVAPYEPPTPTAAITPEPVEFVDGFIEGFGARVALDSAVAKLHRGGRQIELALFSRRLMEEEIEELVSDHRFLGEAEGDLEPVMVVTLNLSPLRRSCDLLAVSSYNVDLFPQAAFDELNAPRKIGFARAMAFSDAEEISMLECDREAGSVLKFEVQAEAKAAIAGADQSFSWWMHVETTLHGD